jgi:hypothetical protein
VVIWLHLNPEEGKGHGCLVSTTFPAPSTEPGSRRH